MTVKERMDKAIKEAKAKDESVGDTDVASSRCMAAAITVLATAIDLQAKKIEQLQEVQ